MMFTSEQVKLNTRFAGWRVFSGEGLAKVSLQNVGNTVGYIGLATNMPFGVVIREADPNARQVARQRAEG